jgi:hypothetical protein
MFPPPPSPHEERKKVRETNLKNLPSDLVFESLTKPVCAV